jgi:hypothetical protein
MALNLTLFCLQYCQQIKEEIQDKTFFNQSKIERFHQDWWCELLGGQGDEDAAGVTERSTLLAGLTFGAHTLLATVIQLFSPVQRYC